MENSDLIPNGWRIVKLGELCLTTSGGTPSRSQSKYYNGNIPWVKSGELDKGLILDTEEKITEEAIRKSSAKIFPKGTLLIALYGATIGKLAFLGVDASTNQAVCGIFKNDNINSKYLFHFLFYKKPSLVKQSIGGAQPNISQGILKNLEIPLPSLPEQQAIVSKLEELLSDLENGKQQLQIAQYQLKTYRQSLLKWAFEGKLTNKNVKDGELPKGWKWVKVSTIGQISTGSTPSKQNPKFYSDDFPFYKPTDLEAGYNVRVSFDNLSELGIKEARFLPVDSVLVTCIGATIGKTGIIRRAGASNQQINAIILSHDYNANYVYYQTIAPKFQQAIKDNAAATTLPILNKSKFQNLEIVSCPLGEQHHIVQELESKLTVCDKIEEMIYLSLQQAETLRQSILKKAFEGRLIN